MKRNRYREAWQSLLRLRYSPVQAARDLYYTHAQLKVEARIVGRSNYLKRCIELFTIPRVRRATLASFVVVIAQQMCGSRLSLLISVCTLEKRANAGQSILLPSTQAPSSDKPALLNGTPSSRP